MSTQTPDSRKEIRLALEDLSEGGGKPGSTAGRHRTALFDVAALTDLIMEREQAAVQQASKALLEAELGQFEILGLNTAEEIKECIRNDIASYSEHPYEQ